MDAVVIARAEVERGKGATGIRRREARAGELVPVGRGGERRAIALANPGLDGRPFATPTLWAAIQYLNARESAPVHRHSQHAFRFVVAGSGVSTVVNGDVVPMRRGDFLPQAGWNWHSHINDSDEPMAWIDGLDIPIQRYVDSTFFEPGSDDLADPPEAQSGQPSQSERLWGSAGLRPLSQLGPSPATPLLVYRWAVTHAALNAQLEMEREGVAATVSPGHAAVRYTNPTTGGDVLPTMR
ncbi:cupin domain-containing protein, partial [Sphaerotilus sp.]|uniref:cupin domain-containing protein n=1 Tax=Sphaerotilus sp. TaxID=2093942 RepID=UPI00286E53E4